MFEENSQNIVGRGVQAALSRLGNIVAITCTGPSGGGASGPNDVVLGDRFRELEFKLAEIEHELLRPVRHTHFAESKSEVAKPETVRRQRSAARDALGRTTSTIKTSTKSPKKRSVEI